MDLQTSRRWLVSVTNYCYHIYYSPSWAKIKSNITGLEAEGMSSARDRVTHAQGVDQRGLVTGPSVDRRISIAYTISPVNQLTYTE